MRILYVEDLETWRKGVVQHFLSCHEVRECSTLEEARRAYVPGNFDLVLLDYELPDGTGAQLARAIRKSGDGVLIVANSSSPGRNTELLAIGADFAVLKSCQEDLRDVLDAVSAGHPPT